MGAKSVWLDIMTPEQLADMAQEYMQLKHDLAALVEDTRLHANEMAHEYAELLHNVANKMEKLLKRGE